MINEVTWFKALIVSKKMMLVLVSFLLLIGYKPLVAEGIYHNNKTAQETQTAGHLLLNAGMVQTQQADISIMLWIEEGTIPIQTWTQLPMPDWIWSKKDLRTGQGSVAVTLSGHRIIDKNEESMIYDWYTRNAPILTKTGVQIYLDERVPEAIDVCDYLVQSQAQPSQWYLANDLVSIAGYQSNIRTDVVAGQDKINIQLLSRGHDTTGSTVLAIPVLLKEF